MQRLIVDLIDVNKDIDYSVFITLFCSYLLILWLIISIWVGTDAYKRFNNRNIAIIFFLLTFFLNFPVLIFYFIVRPETQYDSYEEWETGGVNVPVVNFVGNDGVEMTLELKINPSKMTQAPADMKVDVSFESAKQAMQLVPTPSLPSLKTSRPTLKPELRTKFSTLGGLVKKRITKIRATRATKTQNKKIKPENNNVTQVKSDSQRSKPKSKKHKSKKKRR
jgi:hypothetical protein